MREELLKFLSDGEVPLVKIQRFFCRFGARLVTSTLNSLENEGLIYKRVSAGGYVYSLQTTGEGKANKTA